MPKPTKIAPKKRRYGRDLQWTAELAKGHWTPVPDRFLHRYHRLGISSAEAMLLIHIVSHKWTEDLPYPSARTLAERMGVTEVAVRNNIRSLERKQLLKRLEQPGKANLIDLSPLFHRLTLSDEDLEQLVRPKPTSTEGDFCE